MTGSENPANPIDQFASLDYDGNGQIARGEWHWSTASFRRLDANGDDVLTRREFLAGSDAQNGAAGRPHYVSVNAQEQWTDTGLMVRAGEILSFTARGTVQLAPDPRDTATPAGSLQSRRAPGAQVNAAAGALIGRIGSSTPFLIGAQRTNEAQTSGRLYLGVNDDHFADNSGVFEVSIAVRSTR